MNYDTLSTQAVHAVKRHLIDAIGCALAGYREPVAVIARGVASECQSRYPVTVLGVGRGTTPELAAFANGVMIRCLDFNDTYTSSGGVGHPSDYIPAVLAAAEEVGAPGRVIVEGIAAMYEVFCRLTDATAYGVSGLDHVSNGVIASAVGAGHVLGLSREEMANAVAVAAVANLALHETRVGVVSMWKGCQSANACRNGVFAARLAKRGMTGPPAAFEGRCGIIKVGAPDFKLELLRANEESPAVTQCHLKRYPAGFFSQSAIDSAREVYRRIGPSAHIQSVHLGTFSFGKAVMAGDPQKWKPDTRESADHSLPYLVCTALVHGDVQQEAFTVEAIKDPVVGALLQLLTVEEDPECIAAWPEHARNVVSVTLEDGTMERVVVDDYMGHNRNPMPDSEINAKYFAGANSVIGKTEAEDLLERLWNIDQISNAADMMAVTLAGQDL